MNPFFDSSTIQPFFNFRAGRNAYYFFFAGKGGVGKTSVAAATGITSAMQGKRTVVMSLDMAHSLSDIFDLDKSLGDQNRGKPVSVRKDPENKMPGARKAPGRDPDVVQY